MTQLSLGEIWFEYLREVVKWLQHHELGVKEACCVFDCSGNCWSRPVWALHRQGTPHSCLRRKLVLIVRWVYLRLQDWSAHAHQRSRQRHKHLPRCFGKRPKKNEVIVWSLYPSSLQAHLETCMLAQSAKTTLGDLIAICRRCGISCFGFVCEKTKSRLTHMNMWLTPVITVCLLVCLFYWYLGFYCTSFHFLFPSSWITRSWQRVSVTHNSLLLSPLCSAFTSLEPRSCPTAEVWLTH